MRCNYFILTYKKLTFRGEASDQGHKGTQLLAVDPESWDLARDAQLHHQKPRRVLQCSEHLIHSDQLEPQHL